MICLTLTTRASQISTASTVYYVASHAHPEVVRQDTGVAQHLDLPDPRERSDMLW